MVCLRRFAPLLLPALAGQALAYDLVREYSGLSFFDRWDFFGNWDNLTLGVYPLYYYPYVLKVNIDIPVQVMFGGWTVMTLILNTLRTSMPTATQSSR
jgi:hypothetical protein